MVESIIMIDTAAKITINALFLVMVMLNRIMF
jgi:hypothetical protein